MDKTFKQLYLEESIPFEEIDNYIYKWGMEDDNRSLAEYLGLNKEEENVWVSESEEALIELLDKQKK